jgi:hypothetical protein
MVLPLFGNEGLSSSKNTKSRPIFLKMNRGVKGHLHELKKLQGQGFDDISFVRVSKGRFEQKGKI